MELNSLKYNYKSRGHKTKTYGRGKGSGIGGTSTRGNNGQHQRKSGGVRLGFEGGQTPIYRRLPKIGFKNINSNDYYVLTLKDLVKLPNIADKVDLEVLKEYRVVQKNVKAFKVIGNDKVEQKFHLICNYISKQAKIAIENAGGKVTILPAVVNKTAKLKATKKEVADK